jgi:hypothetical protein
MSAKVLGQVGDALGHQCDLIICAASVFFVLFVILFGSVQPAWPFCPVKAQGRNQKLAEMQENSVR